MPQQPRRTLNQAGVEEAGVLSGGKQLPQRGTQGKISADRVEKEESEWERGRKRG